MTLARIDFKNKHERRVRFADSVGLELASIFLIDLINIANYKNTYNHHTSIHTHKPLKPPSACSSSSSSLSASSAAYSTSSLPKPPLCSSPIYAAAAARPSQSPSQSTITPGTFSCQFVQPITLLSFNERVKLKKVHLQTCHIESKTSHVALTCVIRVLNCSYNKSVTVRYTTDEWRTHTDAPGRYIANSSDGWSDKFTSTFTLTNLPGDRITFCIRYEFDGQHYWDNNGGLNYSVIKK